MKIKQICCFALMALTLTSCGFHIPNQTRLGSSIAEINVTGSYHNDFYKLVIQRLQVRGVKVNYQGTQNRNIKFRDDIPTLDISSPSVSYPVASVDIYGSVKEYDVVITSNSILRIPNHKRPIMIRTGITRYTLNKSDNSLASANERDFIRQEAFEELADQLIRRINYLGKASDPDFKSPSPAELTVAKDENNNEYLIDNSPSMTLIESLQAQDQKEKVEAESVALSDLNNGMRVLNPNKTHELPKVKIKMVNEAPEELTEEGFLNGSKIDSQSKK